MLVAQSCLTFCDLHGLLCPWDSPGKNAGVGSHSLLQANFLLQELSPGLPHCRRILYHLSRQGSPLARIHRHKEKLEESPCHSQSCQEERDRKCFGSMASLVAQTVKNPPAMWETWVRSLGWEDPLQKGMATHSSILAWRILWTEEPSRL